MVAGDLGDFDDDADADLDGSGDVDGDDLFDFGVCSSCCSEAEER